LADLRHLQGYLASVAREREACSLAEPEIQLARLAARQADGLARIADEIEQALAGKEPSGR